MVKFTFFGGPADGGEVPHYAQDMDYVLLTGSDLSGASNDNDVVYYYARDEENDWFIYEGEVEQKDEDNE